MQDIDEKDFMKALKEWYWSLDERCAWDDEEFNSILNKYGITTEDLMRLEWKQEQPMQ